MQPIEWWNSERVARDLRTDDGRDDCISRDWPNCFMKYSSSKLSDSVELIPRKVFVFDELPIHHLLLSRGWASRKLSGTRIALWVILNLKSLKTEPLLLTNHTQHSIIHIISSMEKRAKEENRIGRFVFFVGEGEQKKKGEEENATDAGQRYEQ